MAMAPIAARFFGEPARELRVVGVTGTNGKTTSAYLVRALLEGGGRSCGLLGTVKSVIGGREREVQRTTPEAIDLQADLRAMLDGGDQACAIEVSSHALELGRTDAIEFAAALFTNLTQDHLDFHPTMEDYFLAKRKLFAACAGRPAAPERRQRRRLLRRAPRPRSTGRRHVRRRRPRRLPRRGAALRLLGLLVPSAQPRRRARGLAADAGALQRRQRARRARRRARARRADRAG